MRVTIATAGCLFVLVHAGTWEVRAQEARGTSEPRAQEARARAGELARPAAASICAEPSRVLELSLPEPAAVSGGPALARERAAAPSEDVSVLWCVSPDDPRCAPVEDSSRGGVSLTRDKLSGTLPTQVAPARERAAPAWPVEACGHAREGSSRGIERPPR